MPRSRHLAPLQARPVRSIMIERSSEFGAPNQEFLEGSPTVDRAAHKKTAQGAKKHPLSHLVLLAVRSRFHDDSTVSPYIENKMAFTPGNCRSIYLLLRYIEWSASPDCNLLRDSAKLSWAPSSASFSEMIALMACFLAQGNGTACTTKNVRSEVTASDTDTLQLPRHSPLAHTTLPKPIPYAVSRTQPAHRRAKTLTGGQILNIFLQGGWVTLRKRFTSP